MTKAMNVANANAQVVIGVCDFCAGDLCNEVGRSLRATNPEWFKNNGTGNLLADKMLSFSKKCQESLENIEKLPDQAVWEVTCGFCSEQIRICAKHLQQALVSLGEHHD